MAYKMSLVFSGQSSTVCINSTVDESGVSTSSNLAPVGTSYGSGVRREANSSLDQVGAIGFLDL